jgi:hypothetical protein
VQEGRLYWRKAFRMRVVRIVLPLAVFWIGWQVVVRHLFEENDSEFYARIDWNVKSLLAPQAWPQLSSACGYLLVFVVMMRRRLLDPQLRVWLWLLPAWLGFMFVYGILVETRVFAELIPLVVCSSALIFEELLLERVRRLTGERTRDSRTSLTVMSKAA